MDIFKHFDDLFDSFIPKEVRKEMEEAMKKPSFESENFHHTVKVYTFSSKPKAPPEKSLEQLEKELKAAELEQNYEACIQIRDEIQKRSKQ